MLAPAYATFLDSCCYAFLINLSLFSFLSLIVSVSLANTIIYSQDAKSFSFKVFDLKLGYFHN
jgi:hypothetical protein